MSTPSILSAFLVTPLATPLVFMCWFVCGDGIAACGSGLASVTRGLLFFLVILLFAYAAEILFGLPAWLLFRHYRVRSWSAFACAGALIGWLFYVINNFNLFAANFNFGKQRFIHEANPLFIGSLELDMLAACLSALLFRAIAYSGCPKKDQERPGA